MSRAVLEEIRLEKGVVPWFTTGIVMTVSRMISSV